MEISPVTEEDLGQIVFLENAIEGPDAASHNTLQLRQSMFNEGFLVAREGSKVIGYVETCLWQRETPVFQSDPRFFLGEHLETGQFLYIIFVGVEESHRRHGIGSKLVQAVTRIGEKFGVHSVQAVSREPIVPFYLSMGFSESEKLPGFLPDGQNYTFMEFIF